MDPRLDLLACRGYQRGVAALPVDTYTHATFISFTRYTHARIPIHAYRFVPRLDRPKRRVRVTSCQGK